MQRVTERVSAEYLEQTPVRPVPYQAVLDIVDDYLFERPQSTFLDPWLIISLLALVVLFFAHLRAPLYLVPLAVILVRLGMGGARLWRRVGDDIALLRKGLIVRAHVLALRPHRAITGEIDGALIDCAIPVAPRRTYVGSLWLADGNEALQLSRQGRLEVICLPRTPGTWRLVEPVRSEVRYERMGPVVALPPDV
jgi:hypothetical protein